MQKNETDSTQNEEFSSLEKEEIQKKLDKIKSILQEAHGALKSINAKDLNEIKSMIHPPILIKLTMQCILLLLGHKFSHSSKALNKFIHFLFFFLKKTDPKKDEIWDDSRKVLGDPNAFIKSLIDFDMNSISEEIIKKLKEIFDANPDFSPEKVKRVSSVATALCTWVKAIYSCHEIQKETKNHKDSQKQGEKEEVKAVDAKLNAKQLEKTEKKEEEKKEEAEKPCEVKTNAILQEVLKEISTLNKGCITEIKALSNPPSIIAFTLHLVVLLLEKDPKKKPKRDSFQWKQAQIMMKDPNEFLGALYSFDVTKVSVDVMKEVKEIIDSNPAFKPEIVAKSSFAAKCLCQWVLGMSNYYELQKK